MFWSPRPVPRFWLVPSPSLEAFRDGRFADVVADAGPNADLVFQVLVPTAGFFQDVELAQAAVAFAHGAGVLSTAEAAVAEARAYGYAERFASQTRMLRRWLESEPAPANWLRAAWSAHRSGSVIHALGYASCGLRLAAAE